MALKSLENALKHEKSRNKALDSKFISLADEIFRMVDRKSTAQKGVVILENNLSNVKKTSSPIQFQKYKKEYYRMILGHYRLYLKNFHVLKKTIDEQDISGYFDDENLKDKYRKADGSW